MRTINAFLSTRPTGTLYHYTSADALIGIFRSKALWATDVHHLNDASEYRCAVAVLVAEAKRRLQAANLQSVSAERWRGFLTEWNGNSPKSDSHVISFSTEGNQLSQWRAYCPAGNGYSLGFSLRDLAFARKSSHAQLVKCVYDPTEQEELISAIANYLEQIWRFENRRRNSGLLKGCKSLAYFFHISRKIEAAMLAIKDQGFREENEWRLVITDGNSKAVDFRSGRFGVLPYRAVPLCGPSELPHFADIYVGPHIEPETAKSALRSLLAKCAAPCIDLDKKIKDSGIPYRY